MSPGWRAIRTRLKLFAGTLWVAATAAGCARERPNPGEAMRATTLGSMYLQEGRLAEAEAEFLKVVAAAPDAAAGYANLAQVHLLAGRSKYAESWIRKALRRDPTDLTVHLLRAKALEMQERPDQARAELERLARQDPPDPRVLFALVELAEASSDAPSPAAQSERLARVVELLPGNIAARLRLAQVFVGLGQADSALGQLEELGRLWPDPPPDAAAAFDHAVGQLRTPAATGAADALRRLRGSLELTTFYQFDLRVLQGPRGELAGFPLLIFSPVLDVADSNPVAVSDAIAFEDATATAGLGGLFGSDDHRSPWAVAAGDYDSDGADDLLLSGPSPDGRTLVTRLLHNALGSFEETSESAGVTLVAGAAAASFADYDNDGHLDLYLADLSGRGHLFRNIRPGRFRELGRGSGLTEAAGVTDAVFTDLDHDGDLDLFLTGQGGNRFFRNNLDGSFREMTTEVGLRGAPGGRAAAFGDLDHDGRLDLVVAGDRGPDALFHNLGQQRFEDAAASRGLGGAGSSGVVAIGDYDNDGHFDLFLPGRSDGGTGLYRNDGMGRFLADSGPAALRETLEGIRARGAAFVDYDNDGWLDLVVVGEPTDGGRGVYLWRNMGSGEFEDRSHLLPAIPATGVVAFDYDADSDLDLLITGPTGLRLFRNAGGNLNGYVRIRLTALRTGSGKNNTFGIGARLELRAGALHQTRVVTGSATLIGLGRLRLADVLRVEWPNGVPEVLAAPSSDPNVREAEALKGSCAFVYPWDGERYRFLTDVMWRSALGMPLGIMGSQAAYAPAGASQEYVLIPGDRLVADQGRYRLQMTEELWETAFVDQVKLLVVDHPDSVEVLVNERFVPPEPARLELYQVRGPRPPVAAQDGNGLDVLPLLRHRDDRYVAGFDPGRYQGVVAPHDLILDLGDLAEADSVHLLLNGWIYPTDASINVALSQAAGPGPAAPSLAVPDAAGRWVTVIPDLGFPAGKSKTVIANLSGKFPARDYRVRIRTGMQVYWDQASVVTGGTRQVSRVTTLQPAAADLHYRGFSRTYRKGGRYGPHWFDYDEVSTEPRWQLIDGLFTRFGDVRSLLLRSDDRYVTMAPGDEMSVEFDATALPVLPPGWRRDFLLYSDGWIKDADLNTAHGTTVEPLPYHAMSRYPYGPAEGYPSDAMAGRYREEYHTRRLRRAPE
ncbi:MAG: FG-GAP-like repeat-containing protein [Gemmatimonadota bacterium]